MGRRQSVQRSLVVLAATISLLANPLPVVWSLDGTVDAIQYNAQRNTLQITNSAPVSASLNTLSVNGRKRIILDIENAEIGKNLPNDAGLLKALSSQLPAIQSASINQFGGTRPVVRVVLDLQGEGYEVQLAKANGTQLELTLTSSAPQIKQSDEARTIQEQQKIIAKLQEKLTEVVNRPGQANPDEIKKTLLAMTQKYNDLLKDNQKLRQQLEAPDTTGMKAIELKKLRDTNLALQNEVVKLSQENNRFKQQFSPNSQASVPEANAPLELAKKELVNAIEVINRQNKEIADLKEHIEAVKLQVGASAREQITLLNSKLEEKEAQLKAIQKSGQMLPSGKSQAPSVDVERLLAQLKQKDTQIIALTKQLATASAKPPEAVAPAQNPSHDEIKALKQKLSESEAKSKTDFQQWEQQVKERDAKIATLTEQLKQAFKAKSDRANANEITYSDLKKTLVVLNKKYDELKQENEKLRTAESQNTALQNAAKDEQILALTKQMEQFRNQLDAEKANVAKVNTDAIRYNDLKNTLALMNQKNEALKLENETLKGEALKHEKLRKTDLKIEPKPEDQEALKKLQMQLQTLRADQEKEQNLRNTEMQALLKERAQLLQEAQTRDSQLKVLQEKLTLENSSPKKAAEAEAAQQELLRLRKTLEETSFSNQKLQENLNLQKSDDAARLKTMESKLADLGRAHEETLKESTKLREQLKTAQTHKVDNTELLASQKEKGQLSQTITSLQKQLAEATEKYKTAETGKAQLAQQLKQFQEKQETLAVAATATADLLKEKQGLVLALTSSKEENKKLNTRLTDLQTQLDQAKTANNASANSPKPPEVTQTPEYKKLRQQKEEIATELSGVREQNRALQEELAQARKKEAKAKPALAKETPATPLNGVSREAENYFLEGKKADQETDLTAAVEGYQKAYAIAPENPKYVFALTTTMLALKNYQEAARILQQFLVKDPQNRDAYNQLGKAYLLSGKSDEAQSAFSKAVHLNALSNFATTLKKLGKLAEAERVLKVALSLNPKDSDILFNLGNLYNSSNNLPAAQTAYEQAILAKPDFAEAHYNLGLVCSKTGDKQNAISHLEKYLQLSPEAGNRTVVESYVKRLKGS